MVKPNSKSLQMLIASGNLKGKDQRKGPKGNRNAREEKLKAD